MQDLEMKPMNTVADWHRRALLVRVRGFIDDHLSDPELTPSSIAAAHHISLRYLHKIFEAQDKTVAAWIRHRRLEACRNDLADPIAGGRPVSAIGARWGFPDPASFNRTFRAKYGVPPGTYRRMCA
jgi:AraC-like DNA-binding protein